MTSRTGEAPVFVKIDEYKDVLDMLELIKDKLNEAKRTLANINEMKNEEDSELDMWKTTLNEIERKVDGIDRTLIEPESTW
ncbi:hypothetical protein ISS07_02925 [Candidatus Woesearchaeota archaeon]|nr:hypothetical protein [Candidatus Woesearchaeota archaeon]